jgi:glutamate/tyrosine decarboxylase-like PLP-dependent enzyme
MPKEGTDGAAVHQLIRDELDLDGKPNLNLASFVGTYMEHHADQLMMENIVRRATQTTPDTKTVTDGICGALVQEFGRL